MTSTVVTRHAAAIASLCRRYRVRRLDLFGSAAGRAFDSGSSDIDLLIEFEPLPVAEYADAWFAVKEGLEALFGRPVDLVTDDAVRNPYFRERVEASRESVYAAG